MSFDDMKSPPENNGFNFNSKITFCETERQRGILMLLPHRRITVGRAEGLRFRQRVRGAIYHQLF
ncbi:MAG: hypothetical protein AB3N12_09110 [Ruegeria sp.]